MESKCPVCGAIISDFEDSGFWECEECPFMCALADLPRITAAMELARLTIRMEACGGYTPDTAFAHAKQRVLEVFGGE